jgi:hypothetical protein
MCKEILGHLPKVIGMDVVEKALWAQANTKTVPVKAYAQDAPTVDGDSPNDLKVTVEEDLVSQAEEDDMEALLGTFVFSLCIHLLNRLGILEFAV